MATSTELFQELTTTELVQLKDGMDAEVVRLRGLADDHFGDPQRQRQAQAFAGWSRQKADLAWKLSVIIEARLEEERANR